jgi:transposase
LKFPIYSDEVLDRIIEAGDGLPEDDREVEVLTEIEQTGKALYKRARRREALRACLEGAAEHYTRSYRSGAAPTQTDEALRADGQRPAGLHQDRQTATGRAPFYLGSGAMIYARDVCVPARFGGGTP